MERNNLFFLKHFQTIQDYKEVHSSWPQCSRSSPWCSRSSQITSQVQGYGDRDVMTELQQHFYALRPKTGFTWILMFSPHVLSNHIK